MKKITSLCMSVVLTFSGIFTSFAAGGIHYLPDVTGEMSSAHFWTTSDELLMTADEIKAQNVLTVSRKECCMYDLKNQPETVNTSDLNEALIKSTKADIAYYLGWTYLESEQLASESDFEEILQNTQNPAPQENASVLFGIATSRTNLHTFPSHIAVWDDPKDPECNYQYLESIRVNEPLIITSVSNDGKFYLAKNITCSGWVPASDVAICADKEQWLDAWDIADEKTLVVYGDKVYTEMSVSGKETSDLLLTMGTVLELANPANPNELVDNRAAYQNYAVYLPVRNADGTYNKKLSLISENEKVHIGYLPMTKHNIVSVAMEALGNTYGWGNWLKSDDCSGYIKNVYKCFGLELARNTSWQSMMPMAKIDMQYMCREERLSVLDKLPEGTVLYFNGHEMMYLGKRNDKYYVVSSLGTIMQPDNPAVRQRIRSVVVNTLDVKRANGNMWLDELTVALVPYLSAQSADMPQYEWYHDGVAFCLKNKLMQGDENKHFNPYANITVAELLQILWNKEGNPSSSENTTEAEQKNWYDDAVNWAKENGVTDDKFAEDQYNEAVTREDFAYILYLYACYKGETENYDLTDTSGFADASEISEYAVSAVKYCIANGIIAGDNSGRINPTSATARAEAAVMLQRVFG